MVTDFHLKTFKAFDLVSAMFVQNTGGFSFMVVYFFPQALYFVETVFNRRTHSDHLLDFLVLAENLLFVFLGGLEK